MGSRTRQIARPHPIATADHGSEIVGRAATREGTELVLVRRDGTYQLRVDGRELMNSANHESESELARLALRYAVRCDAPDVLVGGLGMGFTLRTALDQLPSSAAVTVVELVPAVLRWNRGPLAPLARRPLDDPRVTVIRADVLSVLSRHAGRYSAVMLDVDNGPADLAVADNRRLYEPAGLAAACGALRPGGVLAIWSAEPAPDLVERLLQIGVSAWSERVCPAVGDTRIQHAIVLAARPEIP